MPFVSFDFYPLARLHNVFRVKGGNFKVYEDYTCVYVVREGWGRRQYVPLGDVNWWML